MSDDNNTPGATAAITSALAAAGFSADEANILLEKHTAAKAGTTGRPTTPATTSAPAPAGEKRYSVAELAELRTALGLGGNTPASQTPAALPVTSRATPPPNGGPTDDTPIMSMSEADKRALADKVGASAFTARLMKEFGTRNTRVRPRGR